jgi:hypothetical protein
VQRLFNCYLPERYSATYKTEILTSIFNKSNHALDEIVAVLQQLEGQDIYTAPCHELSQATIGQHTRHVIELYQCLLAGYETGLVNYDDRQRNKLYETNTVEAIAVIKEIQSKLQQPDKAMQVVCGAEEPHTITSNYYREVLYNLEHCIHHQALIRVGLITTNGGSVSSEFGVAPSTIQYRRQCAQ